MNQLLVILILFCVLTCPMEGQESAPEKESKALVLNLTNAIARALHANRQLLDTVATLTQAQYGVDLAESEFDISFTPHSQAGYAGQEKGKPEWTIGGGLDFEKKFTTGTKVFGGPHLRKTPHHYVTGIQAGITQPLLRGLGKEYQLSNLFSAHFQLRTAYRQVYMAQIKLIIRTIQALYEIVKAEKSLLLHQESHERIRLFYQAAKIKEKIGLSDALDVYRAEIEWRQAKDALAGAYERLEEAKDLMRDLLALPLDTLIEIDVPLAHSPRPMELAKAIELALQHRIEIEQAEDEWYENQRLAKFAKNNLHPELNLVINYSNLGRARSFMHSCSRHRENRWSIGLTTAGDFYPLSEQIAYEQSLIALTSAARGIDQTKAEVILEVKKTLRQLNRAYERMRLQEEQIKTAQGELSLANIKFDRGMTDNFNVIQAEKSLRLAEQTYWIALIDHLVGEFQLLAVMGLLIDKPAIPLSKF